MGNKIKELDFKNLQKKKTRLVLTPAMCFTKRPHKSLYQHNGETCLEPGRSGEDRCGSKDSLDSLPWKYSSNYSLRVVFSSTLKAFTVL